ncbi:DNA polymerase III PolC-type-like [Mercenaria mercenaria]|uniref:DNA polymerase III PolC-type-like n=1 Tax=Mercenaria mercenaria TaxID=6596 RepID=UPI00234EA9DB|nr:DNA polymerase III PolC-type-like [Mercenaria mercenaria]
MEPLKNCDMENSVIVFYDIETTSLDASAEIVQLSACTDGSCFNRYILPHRDFNRKSSEITGLTVEMINGHRSLCKAGKTLPSTTLHAALNEFIDWLNSLKYEKVILAAHNGKSFDMRLLIQAVQKEGRLNALSVSVYGFVDTLHMLRSVRKDKQSLSLANYYERVFHESFDAHDSSADVSARMRLFNHEKLNNKINEFVLKFRQAVSYLENVKVVKGNRNEIQSLMCGDKKVISKFMAHKIAESGLSYNHLKLAFLRDSVNGLKHVLSEKVNGRPRVTNRVSVIESMNLHFKAVTS